MRPALAFGALLAAAPFLGAAAQEGAAGLRVITLVDVQGDGCVVRVGEAFVGATGSGYNIAVADPSGRREIIINDQVVAAVGLTAHSMVTVSAVDGRCRHQQSTFTLTAKEAELRAALQGLDESQRHRNRRVFKSYLGATTLFLAGVIGLAVGGNEGVVVGILGLTLGVTQFAIASDARRRAEPSTWAVNERRRAELWLRGIEEARMLGAR